MNGMAEFSEFNDCTFQHQACLKKTTTDRLPPKKTNKQKNIGLILCFSEDAKICTIVRTLCFAMSASQALKYNMTHR